MDELLKMSMELVDGMKLKKLGKSHGNITFPNHLEDKASNFNNGIAVYIYNNKIYSAFQSRKLMRLLNQNGFIQKTLYVPLSNGEEPSDFNKFSEWARLRYEHKILSRLEFEEECKEWCRKNNVQSLPSETLQKCFQIPENGLKVKNSKYEITIYPELKSFGFDCAAVEKLGKYDANNGKTIFINTDGKTFVYRGYDIQGQLEKCGFSRSNLFVPMSNGEEILDPYLKQLWDNCRHKK